LDREEACKRYAKAATQGNEATCTEIIEQALRERLNLLEIYQDVLLPAMITIGTWYRVEAIDTAQEHMASAITERMMSRVVQHSVPARRLGLTALLGCGPNSWHTIGLRMVADYLHLSGWHTLFLGANMPNKCFINAVEQHHPDLVLVSCVASEGLEGGLELTRSLSAKRTFKNQFILGVGGQCVTAHSPDFIAAGADFTCSCLRRFAKEVLPEIERSPKFAFREEPVALSGQAL
jgi:methanogenic corrinoid protein MtbC1